MSTSSGWSANRLGRNASMPAIWTGAPIICWARAPAAPAGCVTQRAFGHPQPGDVLDGPSNPWGVSPGQQGCAVWGIVHFGKRTEKDSGKLILGTERRPGTPESR